MFPLVLESSMETLGNSNTTTQTLTHQASKNSTRPVSPPTPEQKVQHALNLVVTGTLGKFK
jgi:hypothetical protein